ncbi:MAG: hypothetical protein OEV78_02745 [Spirochaetia bacterium]|nr:hypothetical protein [Spirochaetia bacterium]
MNNKVLIITNKGENYGTGHFNRSNLLKRHLEKMNIACDLLMGKNIPKEIASYQLVLLDSRDDEFPIEIIEKKNYYLMAMDNRGTGRKQCDLIWDTLPHINMNDDELKTSLKNCILDPVIYECTPMTTKSKIIRTLIENIESNSEIDLIQYAQKERIELSKELFHIKLIKSNKIGTYFGQTFFEALYLGKEIYLYDISEYHKQLSDWFTAKWNELPDLHDIFDGQGLHRLAILIRSILTGTL